MNTPQFIAERLIHAVSREGSTTDVHLGVGTPYEITKDEWACPVCLDGLHDNLRDQHGLDSWQALQLAYQLIEQLLTYFIEDGGKLYWPGIGEEVTVHELLPRAGRA